MPFEDYQALLREIETTQMAPINGHPSCRKIYKMVLLLAMLERGPDAWWLPITPAESAPYFHRFLTDNDVIRELQFNDRDKQQFKYRFDEAAQRFTEKLNRP